MYLCVCVCGGGYVCVCVGGGLGVCCATPHSSDPVPVMRTIIVALSVLVVLSNLVVFAVARSFH